MQSGVRTFGMAADTSPRMGRNWKLTSYAERAEIISESQSQVTDVPLDDYCETRDAAGRVGP